VTSRGLTLPPEGQSRSEEDEEDRRRRFRGDAALAFVAALAWVRGVGRRRRARRDPRTRRLAVGEVIVVHPAESWRDERRDKAIRSMFALVVRRMRRWDVKILATRSIEREHLPGLGRTYVRLGVAAGAENDVVRAINVAAWRHGLPLGRRGVLAVRSPVIVPAANVDLPGPIVFTEAYARAKRRIGADAATARGVRVLVVDWDRPATAHLPEDADVTVLDPSDREILDGHATAVTAVVADIARGAAITTLSIGDEYSDEGYFAFLDILRVEQEADVIVASMFAPEGRKSKDNQGRLNLFDSTFRGRLIGARNPPVLCPTGNHDGRSDERIDTIAIPARFDSVVAIGACDENGRSPGSRYGDKDGDEKSAWWLAPGGSFDATSTSVPLAEMGGRPLAGTSIANAIAGGLAACAISSMREQRPRPNREFDAATAALRRSLEAFPDAAQSLAALDAIHATHSGGAITLPRLLAELKSLSQPDAVPGYNAFEHGCGLLSFQPADARGSGTAPSRPLPARL
jgi:hypothetical protein